MSSINRRSFLKDSVMAAASLTLGQGCSQPNQQKHRTSGKTRRPNVVVIMTDDQRWDCMSCEGHPFLKTPNMDRIAKEGARFANMFVTTSLCSPSRASFLSGLYAHAHKVTNNFTDYPAHLPSYPLETKNLIDEPKYAPKITELKAELHRLMAQTGALPDEMPLYSVLD